MSLRILHFADTHIDIANYGRYDPERGLPVRVVDFLDALDQIVDRAIEEKVDLVLFAGDVYKDRNPQPTFQREWGRRMMRLSQAGIPTILLVGNHDVAPATGRAHTLQEFRTLAVPHMHVADRLKLWGPEELGCAAQVVAIPWVSRHQLMTREETSGKSLNDVMLLLEERVTRGIEQMVAQADPTLPLLMVAHASVQGAVYGSERQVMLGHELVLSGKVVKDNRLDYVALGHIHKHQSLNGGAQPPVVYAGSIERIDFGEVKEDKGYVLAEIDKGEKTRWSFEKLKTRTYLDLRVEPNSAETFMVDVMGQLPPPEKVAGAVCRVQLRYPRDWESLLDEAALQAHFAEAFSLQLQKHIEAEKRSRLGDTVAVEKLTPLQLLATYWQTKEVESEEAEALQSLAQEVLAEVDVSA
ncbi:MAG TPA: exonuclease SbcCD subunit D [Anaerolineae bacterium]|nr:exonuclease SbcCD subunit D [Anaerolineae bacterium]